MSGNTDTFLKNCLKKSRLHTHFQININIETGIKLLLLRNNLFLDKNHLSQPETLQKMIKT